MGKAQSKLSKPKKGEEEVTGKLEKIEDGNGKQLKCDAPTSPESDAEKKQSGEDTENDKDVSTEKSVENAGGGGGGGDSAITTQDNQKNGSESPMEESATKNITAAVEDISQLNDESAKKTKKEKVKKKWSFRSISFGKKDKQKPAKTEEPVAATPTVSTVPASTNGEAEKTSTNDVARDVSAEINPVENGNAAEEPVAATPTVFTVPASTNGVAEKTSTNDVADDVSAEIKSVENGNESEKEWNETNDEKTKVNDVENTETENNDNTGTTTNVKSTTPTANISDQTEKPIAAVVVADAVVTVSNAVNQAVAIVSELITEVVEEVAPILSNGDAAPTSEIINNGDIHETNDEPTASEKADSTAITPIKFIAIVNTGDDVSHLNGTNFDEHVEEQKEQTEEIPSAKDLEESIAAAEISTPDPHAFIYE